MNALPSNPNPLLINHDPNVLIDQHTWESRKWRTAQIIGIIALTTLAIVGIIFTFAAPMAVTAIALIGVDLTFKCYTSCRDRIDFAQSSIDEEQKVQEKMSQLPEDPNVLPEYRQLMARIAVCEDEVEKLRIKAHTLNTAVEEKRAEFKAASSEEDRKERCKQHREASRKYFNCIREANEYKLQAAHLEYLRTHPAEQRSLLCFDNSSAIFTVEGQRLALNELLALSTADLARDLFSSDTSTASEPMQQ